MVEAWGIELAKGIGRFFLNPLVYWSILLIMLAGYKRIRSERNDFGVKVYDVFSEWRHTWIISIVAGVLISLIVLGVGIVFTWETILVLNVVVIILSLSLRFTMLSASYTIGVTYLILLFMPFLLENQTYVDAALFSNVNFTGLGILLGLFLIVEGLLTGRVKRNETYPGLVLGDRGEWIGTHRLKKLSVIPFFTLIPAGMITPFAPFWPYFSIGGESYSLLLIPFVLGFDHVVRGNNPNEAAKKIAKSVHLLGFLVIVLVAGSVYLAWLSLVAVIIAILGREYISVRHRIKDKEKSAYFHKRDEGLKVLAIIPGTPADRIDILAGETIRKVNGKHVHDLTDFYQDLQSSGAFFKLEVIDDTGEVRFVQSALYQGDHHELGIIFVKEPYRDKHKQKRKQKAK